MTGIIEFSTDTLNIEVSGIDQNIPIDLVEVISTGQDVYVNIESNYGPVLAVNGRIGFVTLNKSDVGLSNVENLSILGASGHLQYQIDQLDTGYASQIEIDTLSGLLYQTGSYLYTTINNLSGTVISGYATKINLASTGSFLYGLINSLSGYTNTTFYPKNNPSGFITGVDLSNYVTKTSGEFIDRPTVNGTGVLLSGEAAGSANFRYFPVTGIASLAANNRYSFNTLTGISTGILPLSPQKGDEIELYDAAGTWHINPLIIDNNGNYIEQKRDALECNVRHGLIKLVYTPQNNIGWRIYPMPIHNIQLFVPPSIGILGGGPNNLFSGIIPFYISLIGVNLGDPEQAPVDEWHWNLNTGDGYTVTGQTITYTYTQTGIYDVTLSGSNAAGFDIETRQFNIFLPYLPTVNVAAGTLSGIIPLSVAFTGSNTTQPQEYSPVNEWKWDANNDGFIDFSGITGEFIYNQAGLYDATAYAINLGGTGSGSIIINAFLPYVPAVNVTANKLSGIIPLSVIFNATNTTQPQEYSPVDQWQWDVDNNGIIDGSSAASIFYTFNNTGIYNSTAYASNLGGTGAGSITINAFLPYIPTVNITSDKLSGIIPLTVDFTGTNTTEPAEYSPVDQWQWDADNDGNIDFNGATGTFTYNQTGLYSATAYAINLGGTGTNTFTIDAFLPYVPTVNITSSQLSGTVPFTGQLSAVNTTQPQEYSPVDNWYWDFDGDAAFDFTGQNATVTYNTTGSFTTIAYGTNLGGTGTGFITINIVEPLPPIPAISTFTASGFAPLTIQLSGINLENNDISPVNHWYWDVSGDSAPEFDQRVIDYTFNETGTYIFYLTAANSAGSGIASGIITVLEFQPYDEYSDYTVLLLHANNDDPVSPFEGISE